MAEPHANGVARVSNLATIVVSALVVGGALWGVTIKPVEGRVSVLEVRGDKRDDRLDANERDIIALTEKLKEVETQFRWKDDIKTQAQAFYDKLLEEERAQSDARAAQWVPEIVRLQERVRQLEEHKP